MDPVVGSAIISGIGNLAGGLVDNYFNSQAMDKSYKFQKKVLQNQVQWRVEDAIKAGLHPLAALGMSPASGPSAMVGSSLGSALSDMGQNIGRAAEAYLTPQDKAAARLALLAEERAGLENDLLRSQIAGSHKALLTAGATPGVASALPTLPGDPVFGPPNVDPKMNQRLQDRHGEMADVITAPHSVMEVLRSSGQLGTGKAQLWPGVLPHRGYVPNTVELEPWY